MGPKTFITCYVCFKEFGSKSITFHEPKCLERWRSSNKNLPNDKRTPSPVKPPVVCSDITRDDWVCSNCFKSVPSKRKITHISVCSFSSSNQSGNDSKVKRKSEQVSVHSKESENNSKAKNLKSSDNYSNAINPQSSDNYSNAKNLESSDIDLNVKSLKSSDNYSNMTGVVKAEFSPKKGKENKNSSNNHIPVPSVGRKNARNDSKDSSGDKSAQTEAVPYEVVEVTSTSDRSVRPQTKILRRPTPNLKHPVIQVDSDDSSGDSSCSDKSKDDNPKRLKMGSDSDSGGDKPKNFILYNKNNVEKNTIKSSPKERASANAAPTIPNPCNSCNRSLAPERLHSHAKKDSRGLMYRKSPSLDLKIESTSAQQKSAEKSPTMASSQQKVPEILNKSPNKDVKIASPHQKVPEISNKSPNTDVKMSSPRKKVFELSENTKMATSPQQKLSKLPKPLSLDIKPIYSTKIPTPDAYSKPLTSDGKSIPKLTKLDKSTADTKAQQKQTESLDKPQHFDTKVASPKKQMSRSNPYKVLNKIPVQKEHSAFKISDSKDTTEDKSIDSLTVPDEQAPKAKDEEIEKSCYICLKEFKASVLLMHESRCLENWKRENNSLTPNLRQLPPRRPTSDDDDEFDDDLVCTSMQSQLVPCDLCGRTFFPERLPVHSRVCKGKSSPRPLKRAASLRERSASSTEGEEVKPAVYVPCYVCGRNYGSWVISMHEQQCLKKWRRENDKLPDEEQKEEPKKYPDYSPDEDVASLAELGNNAWESHLQQLVPCPLCSRTFFPGRLGVHKRSCKGPPTTSSRRPRSKMGA